MRKFWPGVYAGPTSWFIIIPTLSVNPRRTKYNFVTEQLVSRKKSVASNTKRIKRNRTDANLKILKNVINESDFLEKHFLKNYNEASLVVAETAFLVKSKCQNFQ